MDADVDIRNTLGNPPDAGPQDVVVDDDLIDPNGWQPVALPKAVPVAGFGGVSARFDIIAHAAMAAVIQADARANAPEISQDSPISAPESVDIIPAAPAVRLPRVIRRPVARRQEQKPASQPAPERRPVHAARPEVRMAGAAPRSVPPTMRLDRGGQKLIVGLMVGAWVGVVGIGSYFAVVPKSGAKIEWRK